MVVTFFNIMALYFSPLNIYELIFFNNIAFSELSGQICTCSDVAENERPFKCEYCEKRFTQKGHLQRHRYEKHGMIARANSL